ncbi:hypothetical protein NE237_028044 [Protea cynaroides]|uniref:Uncharacterized protein n=1 Tax=Protea cynaroides TaxID=273540 RepID=A0A9Q0JTQ4_9MAGN|nr:hypothetical protein NE237_028044 [Protea cynaroides]
MSVPMDFGGFRCPDLAGLVVEVLWFLTTLTILFHDFEETEMGGPVAEVLWFLTTLTTLFEDFGETEMVSMIFDARGTIVHPQFTFVESFEVESDMDWPSSSRNCQVFSKTLRGVYLRVLMVEINGILSFLLNSSTVIVFMDGEMLLIFYFWCIEQLCEF